MTTQFKTTKLAGARVLVEGTDVNGIIGRTVLSSAQLDNLRGSDTVAKAQEAYEQAERDFYAPIKAAAEALKSAVQTGTTDERFIYHVSDAVKSVAGQGKIDVTLTNDSAVLRIIEENPTTDQVIWVGEGLEIVAA
jgi:hypothetical protein